MREESIKFETAKLAKEKGFNIDNGNCFDEKEKSVDVCFFSGVCVVPFVAWFRFCIRWAVLRLTYVAPRDALQLAHDPTMLVLS